MTTVTMEEAQANLPKLIEHLIPGEEILITHNEQPIARLMASESGTRQPRKAGSAKGKLTIITEDDEHLQGFEESA
jgi:antitoxin (DNA-binding transcriptional repressor) of toxin-antitoxin stability system